MALTTEATGIPVSVPFEYGRQGGGNRRRTLTSQMDGERVVREALGDEVSLCGPSSRRRAASGRANKEPIENGRPRSPLGGALTSSAAAV
jgi:hypothetical protein